MTQVSLPPVISVDGDWCSTCARLYGHFEAVFKTSPPRKVRDKTLVYDKRILDDKFEEGFWHIITSGKGDNRLFDPDRARRIGWIEAILSGAAPGLSRWAYQEGDGSIKLYYWLETENYVLILVEKPTVVVLVTAFYIDKPWLAKDLSKRRAAGTAF